MRPSVADQLEAKTAEVPFRSLEFVELYETLRYQARGKRDRTALRDYGEMHAMLRGALGLRVSGQWSLPPYRSRAFMAYLGATQTTLEQFRQRPLYEWAVENGLIRDDKWMGRSGRKQR